MSQTSEERVATVVSALMDKLREGIVEHKVTYDEYAVAKKYAIEVGEAGEWPLFSDVFFESTVEHVNAEQQEGSDGAIEGPYYLPGAKVLSRPYVMPMRPNEPGDVLFFSGTVRSADGIPIPGAWVDLWHSDNLGTYSDVAYPDDRELPPSGNLRARFQTDADGYFEVRTIIPVPYEIPKTGPTGALLAAAGWHAYRPAHLHTITAAPGHQSLTSQLYFDEDPYIPTDVASAVKQSLILTLDRHSAPEDLKKHELDKPYYTTSYDFRLAEA